MSDTQKQKFGTYCPPKAPMPTLKTDLSEDLGPEEMSRLNEELEEKLIQQMISLKSREQLISTKFFLVSSNIQCYANGEYRPLEIGIVEYSIKDGVTQWYNQFINCGRVPFGFFSDAKEHSERTHKLPLDPTEFALASDQFDVIGATIYNFIKSDETDADESNQRLPMVLFSMSDQIEQNSGSLKWIAHQCNKLRLRCDQPEILTDVRVLNVNKLLHYLMEAAKSPQTLIWCEKMMTSPAFDYSPGTDCQFHTELECIDCALGVGKRMAYLLSHCLTKLMKVAIQPKHFPLIDAFTRLSIKEENETSDDVIRSLLEQMKKDNNDNDDSSSLVSKEEKVALTLDDKDNEKENEAEEKKDVKDKNCGSDRDSYGLD